jgi:hypothetical protein
MSSSWKLAFWMLMPGLVVVVLLPASGWAQAAEQAVAAADVGSLEDASQAFMTLQRRAMWTLGGWAVGNLAAGPALAAVTSGSARQFWVMSAGWNVVNLAIAGWALTAGRPDPAEWQTLMDVEQAQGAFRRLLWINAGLDVGYVATGAWLASRGARTGSDRQLGFGRAVMVQGVFLLVFDTTVALLAH